jgi:hypothetical protein
LGHQNTNHNRSESVTVTPGGGNIDRGMIDFLSAKHHNNSTNSNYSYHPAEKKVSSTPQPIIGHQSSSSTAFNKKKK